MTTKILPFPDPTEEERRERADAFRKAAKLLLEAADQIDGSRIRERRRIAREALRRRGEKAVMRDFNDFSPKPAVVVQQLPMGGLQGICKSVRSHTRKRLGSRRSVRSPSAGKRRSDKYSASATNASALKKKRRNRVQPND
jgi:hypothetical protein